MLLVLSKSQVSTSNKNQSSEETAVSSIAVWDFLDGHKDILCQSHLPINVIDGRFNWYLGGDSNEFVTVSEKKYHYWKIAGNLSL